MAYALFYLNQIEQNNKITVTILYSVNQNILIIQKFD
jgi:hypothetical protein